jgi:tetratricopeptide (TPR) repeat protein/transcriptional regulator with XRE-family HTH domain
VFQESVRAHRMRLGLTQEDLAAKAGVDVKTVRDIESGRRRPRLSTVRRLADVLGLDGTVRAEFHAAASGRETATGTATETAASEAAAAGAEAASSRSSRPPAQLPLDVLGFSGRRDQLAALDTIAETVTAQPGATVVCAVWGTAGVGKTALAVHWAHRVRQRFPDGQLFVNLRGFDPAGAPVTPSEAICLFLDALGVAPQRIPADLDAQCGLYRTHMAGKRMLLVLDNAQDADQVRPLLPGAPGCLVLVTSRRRLTGLVVAEGARPVPLDLLDVEESRELLARRVGAARVAAEPDAVDEIVVRCARLPLALAIVAARATIDPYLPLAVLAADLADGDRLDALSAGDPTVDVEAVFSWSYRALSEPAARLFRLLGVHPGADLSTSAAASLAAVAAPRVRRLLSQLTQAHLVTEHQPGRYAVHDLLRAYAGKLAREVEPESHHRDAVHRVLDHYLHSAYSAAQLIDPCRDPITVAPPRPGVVPEHPADHRAALDWFRAEHRSLVTAVERAAHAGWDTHAWQLAWALATYLERRGHWHDQVAVQRAALTAAQRLADPGAEALTRRIMARAYINLDRTDDADAQLRTALGLYQRAGDRPGQGHTHINFGLTAARQGHYAEALRHARQALELFRTAGHRRGQAVGLSAIGWYCAQLGDFQQSLDASQRALALHQELGDGPGEAHVWDSLGYVHQQLAQHARAAVCYQRGLDLFRRIGDRHEEATTLVRLGDTCQATGNADAAHDAWRRALAIFEDLGRPAPDRVRASLRAFDRSAAGHPVTAAS